VTKQSETGFKKGRKTNGNIVEAFVEQYGAAFVEQAIAAASMTEAEHKRAVKKATAAAIKAADDDVEQSETRTYLKIV
jgi:hypothetical protein